MKPCSERWKTTRSKGLCTSRSRAQREVGTQTKDHRLSRWSQNQNFIVAETLSGLSSIHTAAMTARAAAGLRAGVCLVHTGRLQGQRTERRGGMATRTRDSGSGLETSSYDYRTVFKIIPPPVLEI